jgi:hypothetical protein
MGGQLALLSVPAIEPQSLLLSLSNPSAICSHHLLQNFSASTLPSVKQLDKEMLILVLRSDTFGMSELEILLE